MRKKKRNKKPLIRTQVPKDIRYTLEFITSVPFWEMDDDQVLDYFKNNGSFLKRYMYTARKNYKTSLFEINRGLLLCDKNDFANYVRLCRKAFFLKTETKRRFIDFIVEYLVYFNQELEYDLMKEDLVDPIPYYSKVLCPKEIDFKGHKYLYDFSFDFFYNQLDEYNLKIKYKLNGYTYKKFLKEIYEQGIVPTHL